MAPRRTQTTAAKATDDKVQETAAEQQGQAAPQVKAEEKPKAEEKGADEKPAPKTQPKAEAKTEEKVDIAKGSENRDPIPAPEQHQDRAMNQVDSYVSNAATVGVEGSEDEARKRMLQVSQIDTSSPSGYTDVFRAMVNPPENAVKASKAKAEGVDSKKN